MQMNPQEFATRARELEARLPEQLEEARRNLSQLNTRAVTFIRQNPGACLVGAVAVGFLIGKLASRR